MNRREERLLELEEQAYMLRQLTVLTKKRELSWECTELYPLELMSDYTDGMESCYLAQTVFVKAKRHARIYLAEFFESIEIPSEKEILDLQLTILDKQRPMENAEPVGFALFPKRRIVEFVTAVLPQIAASETVERCFARQKYHYGPDSALDEPLKKIGKLIYDGRRICDYHRLVTDALFRETLKAEILNGAESASLRDFKIGCMLTED